MKRVRQATSAASSAKRSAAPGSRSIAMSSPPAPKRSATRRAWPPPPKVQSIATSPGCGSSRSMSSPASTGTCAMPMSTSMAEGGGDVGELVGERRVVPGPVRAVPDLEAVAGAGHHDLLAQPGVLEQEARHHDAPGGVEVAVERVGAEEARELAGLLRERVHALQRGPGVGLEVAGCPHLHAALDALGEDYSIRQRSPELGRDGEPVLRVEAVVEGSAEGHVRRARGWEPGRERRLGPRWRSGRSPSTPVRCATCTPLPPTTQPNLHISSHLGPCHATLLPTKWSLGRDFAATMRSARRGPTVPARMR